VDKFLDDLETRYGGVDAILLWPTYTNIGADDRNQFDLFRAMPGGLAAVRNITTQLHARGVRVLWPYNPWDTGTEREPLDDEHTFAKLLKETGGDGFNGDTMGFVPESFWAAANANAYPYAIEPEGGGEDASLNWDTMGWGYWAYPKVPVIDRFKFLTRGKFMTNICDRWAFRKTDNLQSAWLSGTGYESWENVWGTWNGIVPRDAEGIRRVAHMLRFLGGKPLPFRAPVSDAFPVASRDYLHSSDWEPHVSGPMHPGVFASRFPLMEEGAGSRKTAISVNNSTSTMITTSTLYTLVNRGGKNLTGQQLWLPGPLPDGATLYDCYHGTELTPETPVDPPPPTPKPVIPDGYNLYQNKNSYVGHGAGRDIDDAPLTGLTVAQCTARCDADDKCDCVTFAPDGGECWKRAACEPSGFDETNAYDVYKRARGYTTWPSANAYAGHGGVEIDVNPAPGALSAAQCTARCDADPKCGCVTYLASKEQCWKRARCSPTQFDGSSNAYETFVKESAQPSCAEGCGGDPVPAPQGAVAVSFPLEADGFGCVLMVTSSAAGANPNHEDGSGDDLDQFLADMRGMTKGAPLSSFDDTWRYLLQTRVPIAPTKPAGKTAPEGTVLIPQNKNWLFNVSGVMVEGDDQHGVDVQYPWDAHPHRSHSQVLSVGPFYMDKYPVTTTNYSAYLAATGFTPLDTYRWLKNWGTVATEADGAGETGVPSGPPRVPPAGIADMPVTYVSLEEARAYCAWKGARLPHEHEWQYAAQGNDNRAYPWGDDKNQDKYPKVQNGNVFQGPESVFAHDPKGASPFGVVDMVGNVYQYTDEFQDDHTRSVIVRGGANYYPQGSMWYFPESLELGTHEKYFLMDDRYERAGTIGFRCVVDV
jgi:formylglycine-generating enzyme required for sulfatase activity